MRLPVTLDDVGAAASRIATIVNRTPVMFSRQINDHLGCEVFFKCENLQRSGSFKMRGATHAIARLSPEARARGVVTHSSGNHAQALALAGKLLGARVTVVMPETAPRVKREAAEGYGATVVPCAPTLEARREGAETVIQETGATLIHPYDDARVVAGQGTAALEMLAELEHVDLMLAPVGGGGLLSGTAVAVTGGRRVRVVGCEPAGADDAYRSLTTGIRVTKHEPRTFCEGLLTTLGEIPFEILQAQGVEIVRVEDDEIRAAMTFFLERTKLIIEPSAAVPFAALFAGKLEARGERVGVILSGGNVDMSAWVGSL